MIYRKLGRTNVDVGVIGMGCEYLWHSSREDVVSVVQEAVDNGVNFLDLFVSTPQTRENYGYALKGRRDKVLLAGHLGSVDQDGQYQKSRDKKASIEYINQFYSKLQTDYIDVLFLHNCDEEDDRKQIFAEDGLYSVARDLQQQGKARFIGFSTHNTQLAIQVALSGKVDVIMFPINPLFDLLPRDTGTPRIFDKNFKETLSEEEIKNYPEKKDLYLTCLRENVGLVSMKPYAGGNLLKEHTGGLLQGMLSLTPVQCISYALSQPGVAAVIPGCKSLAEIHAALNYLHATEIEKDYGEISESDLWKYKDQCQYCNHCLPCPVKIDIAEVTRLKDAAEEQMTESLKAQYQALEVKASECTACGACESRCPFGVDSVENMQRAAVLFEG